MDIAYLIWNFVWVLAWPLTILIIVLIFRKPLAQAITAVEKFRFKDWEIEFSRGLKIAEDKAKGLKLPPPQYARLLTETPISPYQHLFDLASTYPRAAVTEAWLYIEMALRKLASARGITTKGIQAEREVLRKLTLSGELPDGTTDLYDRLRNLRNQAVHAVKFDISSREANSYVDLALSLASRFESASDDSK